MNEYKSALVGAHRNVRFFFVASFLTQISSGFFSVLYNLYIKSQGLPDPVAGYYVSAGSIAGAISLVPAGMLSDRIGRKRAMFVAGVLSSLLYMVQAVMRDPVWIVAGAFATGLVTSVIWVSALPLLAENTRKDERFHLFSVNFGVTLAAQVLGNLLAGGMSGVLGHTVFAGSSTGELWSVRVTLLTGAVIGLSAMIPFSRIEENRGAGAASQGEEKKRQPMGAALRAVRERRDQLGLIVRFTISSAIIGFGAGLVIPYLNLYFLERFHMPKAGIGVVMALGQAVTALAMFVGPAAARRFGPVRSASGFQLISIPFLIMTAFFRNLWFASGAVILRQALMNCSNPIQDSVMMALVDDDLKGFAVSSGQTMFTLGWAVMGPVSTTVVHHYGAYTGYAIVFSVTAGMYLVGALFYRASFRRFEGQVYSDGVSA